MLENMSLNYLLMKAKSHANMGDLITAKKLYKIILQKFFK